MNIDSIQETYLKISVYNNIIAQLLRNKPQIWVRSKIYYIRSFGGRPPGKNISDCRPPWEQLNVQATTAVPTFETTTTSAAETYTTATTPRFNIGSSTYCATSRYITALTCSGRNWPMDQHSNPVVQPSLQHTSVVTSCTGIWWRIHAGKWANQQAARYSGITGFCPPQALGGSHNLCHIRRQVLTSWVHWKATPYDRYWCSQWWTQSRSSMALTGRLLSCG